MKYLIIAVFFFITACQMPKPRSATYNLANKAIDSVIVQNRLLDSVMKLNWDSVDIRSIYLTAVINRYVFANIFQKKRLEIEDTNEYNTLTRRYNDRIKTPPSDFLSLSDMDPAKIDAIFLRTGLDTK